MTRAPERMLQGDILGRHPFPLAKSSAYETKRFLDCRWVDPTGYDTVFVRPMSSSVSRSGTSHETDSSADSRSQAGAFLGQNKPLDEFYSEVSGRPGHHFSSASPYQSLVILGHRRPCRSPVEWTPPGFARNNTLALNGVALLPYEGTRTSRIHAARQASIRPTLYPARADLHG